MNFNTLFVEKKRTSWQRQCVEELQLSFAHNIEEHKPQLQREREENKAKSNWENAVVF